MAQVVPHVNENAIDPLTKRLRDQRITDFNSQMRVREEAADEIERLQAEIVRLLAPKPCQHNEMRGSISTGPDGHKSEWWCVQCGQKLQSQELKWQRT